ncbi:MAG: RNA 2',3'-cyclic phosphodiesterase [Gammaproteobacteria bacterium]|nr:RNA 2',3'-cyclic phosphodiesterase [Gammaproteobacteria bacterium]
MPGDDTQRLFFALWPDEGVKGLLRSLQESVSPKSGRAVVAEDLHITLAFLGSVERRLLGCVEGAAQGVSGVPPFSLKLDQLGHWPRSGILWCGPGFVPVELRALVRYLWRALMRCGFTPDDRAYTPHVTCYRRSSPISPRELLPALNWPVREFVLVRSIAGGSAPRYRIIKKWSLDS